MGTALTAKKCVQVTLLRPNNGHETFELPEGATLADLLREAGEPMVGPGVVIDGKPIEEFTALKSGMTVSLAPVPPPSAGKRSWRDSLGAVQDTPEFREMIAAGRAIRDADTAAARERVDQDPL